MSVIYVHERPLVPPESSIFLAGPSPRAITDHDWRRGAVDCLNNLSFTGDIYVPLPRNGIYQADYDHEAQIAWELQHLADAHAIAFWIPRNLETLPGFTTNMELGMYIASGKVVLGYPTGAPKMRYPHFVANRYNVPVHHTMEDTMRAAIWIADNAVNERD